MAKYRLGDRVQYTAHMQRIDTKTGKIWTRLPVSGEGIIVGKRTCSDGYNKGCYSEDGGYTMVANQASLLLAGGPQSERVSVRGRGRHRSGRGARGRGSGRLQMGGNQ